MKPYWHYHPELELTLIKKGMGMRFVGDHVASYNDGDLVLIGENLPHQWISDENKSYTTAHVFHFSKEAFKSFPECDGLIDMFGKAEKGIHFIDPPYELVRKCEFISTLSPIHRLSSLLEILAALDQHEKKATLSSISFNSNKTNSKVDGRISKVTNYLITNYSKPISLSETAEIADMSPHSFCRWFKTSMGMGLLDYLNTYRIEKVCQALITTNYDIAEIAYRNGFESLSNFNRTFRRIKNTTPRDYRNRSVETFRQ